MNGDVIAAFRVVMAFRFMQKSDAILLCFQTFHILHQSLVTHTTFRGRVFILSGTCILHWVFEINANHFIGICNFMWIDNISARIDFSLFRWVFHSPIATELISWVEFECFRNRNFRNDKEFIWILFQLIILLTFRASKTSKSTNLASFKTRNKEITLHFQSQVLKSYFFRLSRLLSLFEAKN